MKPRTTTRRALLLALGGMMISTLATAQAQVPETQSREVGWLLGASAGAFVPMSALILASDGRNTELSAGPHFGIEAQYVPGRYASAYASATAAFSTVALGSSIRPDVVGPSNQVTLLGGTAGVLVTLPASDRLEVTLRLGGGIKGYLFDLTDAATQWRATGDFGLGLRGGGTGPIAVMAEVRYLPSSFDQSKLPIRGITPQAQQQNDLILGIAVSIRP